MIIADCHNDTPYRLFFEKGNLLKNNFNIDIKKQGIHKTLLFYAIFMDYERYGDNPRGYFLDIYKNMKKEFDKNSKGVLTTGTCKYGTATKTSSRWTFTVSGLSR